MRLKSIATDPVFAPDQHGNEYATGEFGPKVYVMDCKCGAEKRVPVHEFPGKWNLRWCGEEDCAYSPENLKRARHAAVELERQNIQKTSGKKRMGRPASNDPSINLTISMPSSVFLRIRGLAVENGKSMSQRITELVCLGELKAMEDSEGANG